MRRPRTTKNGRGHGLDVLIVDGVVPNPHVEQEPLPDQVLAIALDQRAFGPRQLMVAFAAYDGRFLALLHTRRTAPIETALKACLLHFDALGRGGETRAAAVVLCDEPVEHGPPSERFLETFERASTLARRHGVHLVDWIACDDDRFRCVRLRTFFPATEEGWWDMPDAAAAS